MDSAQRLEANAKQAGKMFDWRSTSIGSTEGGLETDPFAELKTIAKSIWRESRSYGKDAAAINSALDAVEELSFQHRHDNAVARGYLCGLRFYLGMLPAGERPLHRVVQPLIDGFNQHRNRS